MMELPSPKPSDHTGPLFSISKLWFDFCRGVENGRQWARHLLPPAAPSRCPPFASSTQEAPPCPTGFPTSDLISTETVARSISGTSVYTVSNANNEFVLISNPKDVKSIGLLCFRREDAESLLSEIRARKDAKLGGKVVPIRLDQVYMLKVEGIAFRFLPDPVQIKNALEIRSAASKPTHSGFNGVPVFQSDLLTVRRKGRRYCPVYFRKEDVERELLGVGRRGGGVHHHIVVECMEDVLRKIETSAVDSGWGDVVFIPPGKSHSHHFEELEK